MSLAFDTTEANPSSRTFCAADMAKSAKVDDLGTSELIAYHAALQAVADALVAHNNTPRLRASAISTILEDMIEAYDQEASRVVEMVRGHKPTDPWTRADRARFLIGWECSVSEGLPEIAALAAALASDGRQ